MKHIFLFLLALAPTLAFAQTGTVKDSVRVLTTAEIQAGSANDTANFYFIQGGSWKKIRMDSVFNYLRFRGMVDTFRNQTIFGAKTFNTAPTFNTALGIGSGGTGSTTQNFVDLTTTQNNIGGEKTFTANFLNTKTIRIKGSGDFNVAGNASFRITNTDPNPDRTFEFFVKSSDQTFQIVDSTGGGATRLAIFPHNNPTQPGWVQFESKTQFNSSVPRLNIAGVKGVDIGTNADGDFIDQASDASLKNSIQNISYGIGEILRLNPVSFLWNDANRKIDSDVPDLGFIAQDVINAIPEAVKSSGNGTLRIEYEAITATLVKAMQEQQAQIEALKTRISQLENK